MLAARRTPSRLPERLGDPVDHDREEQDAQTRDETRARVVRQRHPERLVEEAVHGMLPKTKLGAAMYRKLKVYAGADHPHASQKPKKIKNEVA